MQNAVNISDSRRPVKAPKTIGELKARMVHATLSVRDWKEVFDYSSTGLLEIPVSDDALLKKINQWPENPPEFKEACEEYVRQTEKLAVKLVELISLSLALGADRLKVWSNAEYESPEHRAILNPEKDRISIPFFFNSANYTMVEPLEELISDERPSKYKAYN
uniref:Isopenicillin N synthase-like Fe(2+) 2OG dioxygenase domain-containing protein n=1 Tax=Kalanchoe fedtschenkoi TaxID=63787 RepID=A0A7N0TAT2_KALFE